MSISYRRWVVLGLTLSVVLAGLLWLADRLRLAPSVVNGFLLWLSIVG